MSAECSSRSHLYSARSPGVGEAGSEGFLKTVSVPAWMALRTSLRLPLHNVVATVGMARLMTWRCPGLRLSVVIAAPHKSNACPLKGVRVRVRVLVRVRLVFAEADVFALAASLEETSVMLNEWTGRKRKKKMKRTSTARRSTDEDDTEIINLQYNVELAYSTLMNIKFSVKYGM